MSLPPEFLELYGALPRQGPGNRASLDRAMQVIRPAKDAACLDAGCGVGADISGLLAHVPDGSVDGFEFYPEFAEWAARKNSDPRVRVRTGDMLELDATYDLIWSMGAVYIPGVNTALRRWKPHLGPGGKIAFSEIVWLTDTPPIEAQDFWASYPAMTHLGGIETICRDEGYRVLDRTVLPDDAWEAYYHPLEARIAECRKGTCSEALTAVMDEAEAEIALWRAHRRAFGYGLFVVKVA